MKYRPVGILLLLWLTLPSVNAIVTPKAVLPLGDPNQPECVDLAVSTPEAVYTRNHGAGSGFRFYAPSLQRWINQDPMGEAEGIDLYRFIGNDPMNVIDPFGLAGTHPGVHLHPETMKFLLEEAMEAAAVELGIPLPQLVNTRNIWDKMIRKELLDPKRWDLSEFHKLIRSAKRSKKCPDQTLCDILEARDRGDLHSKKEKIIRPFLKLMKGRTNPDIFFDEKGRVVLRARDGKTTIPTGKTLDEILPDLFK